MNLHTFESMLSIGETVAVEFKRCGNGIEHDVYESVCSFLKITGVGWAPSRCCGRLSLASPDMMVALVSPGL